MVSAQSSQFGTLYNDGWCYFDWLRPGGAFTKQKSILVNGGTLRLQSRFMWRGSGTIPFVENKTGEHALVAYTYDSFPTNLSLVCPQKQMTESLLNSPQQPGSRQPLHKYGIGALITPKGLALEVWNGDGTAYVWTQYNNRCAISVPSGANAGMCLSSIASETGSYLTPSQGFNISKGTYYWLRLTLEGNPGGQAGWLRVHGEMLQQSGSQVTQIQSGQIYVQRDQFFPGTTLAGTIGRSGPEYPETDYIPEFIDFWSYDHF